VNAVSSHLGVQDYELLANTIRSGTDVVLSFNQYGTDNKIFEKLDGADEIDYTTISFVSTGERNIICYSATKGGKING
ncbi:hypothetical protein OAJ94_01505, partial [Deltaproteobacteria bacterium]|nr:hypothetical protein [Deltaproteobacteria bacterium]